MMRFFRRKAQPRPLASLDAYARWAAEYPPHAHNALMRAEEAALLDLLPSLDGHVVLDAACGTGRYTQLALERGARCVVATDNSAAMLKTGRDMSRSYAATPLKGRIRPAPTDTGSTLPSSPHHLSSQYPALSTCEALPLATASIDVAICGLAIGHLPHIERTMAELGRVLVAGGAALVSDVHPFLFINGAQRTFTHEGKTFAVEHYVHLYSAVHAAAQAAGLRIDAVREPTLLPADRTADAPTAPVAIVYRMVKV